MKFPEKSSVEITSSQIILICKTIRIFSSNQIFSISQITEIFTMWQAKSLEFQLNIKTFPDTVSPYQLFDRLVKNIKERCQMESNDKMRMTILHPGLKLGVFVPY